MKIRVKIRACAPPIVAGSLVTAIAFMASDAAAYRMSGVAGRVTCSDPAGFLHQAVTTVPWYLDSAEHAAGGAYTLWHNAFRASETSWTNVTPAGYVLSFAGYTTAAVSYNGKNTVNWLRTPHCSSCLAVTVTTYRPSDLKILDSDIEFDQDYAWSTTGSGQDVQSVATHELGHSMGIAHSNLSSSPYPTMYAYYMGGTGQRSLEVDDTSALNCAWSRYHPTSRVDPGSEGELADGSRGDASETGSSGAGDTPRLEVRESSSQRLTLRFSMPAAGDVRLQIFDVSGRLVRTIVNERRAAGDHEVAWDGRSESGMAPLGVYFARLTTAAGTVSQKVALTN